MRQKIDFSLGVRVANFSGRATLLRSQDFRLTRTFVGSAGAGEAFPHHHPRFDVDEREDIRPHLLPGELPFQAYAGVPLLAGEELTTQILLATVFILGSVIIITLKQPVSIKSRTDEKALPTPGND